MNVCFLGTPSFVQPVKVKLAKHFTLADSLNQADLAVIAAYGKILTKKELEIPKFGCINVHPSLLPKYRGPSPIQQTILNGDKKSGITIIKMDVQVDHGPIIYREQMELSDIDNFQILSKKMFLQASEILPKIIIDFVSGKIKPVPQDHSKASYCPLLTRDSGYFDINNPPDPEKLDRMIRAYYPWPGVWTRWNDKIVKFIPVTLSTSTSLSVNSAKGIYSSATPQNDRFLIQMEGKKPISIKDFLNGYPDFPMKTFMN